MPGTPPQDPRDTLCIDCGESKPPEAFYRRSGGRPGLRAHCKACHAARRRRWRQANPEVARVRHREEVRRARDKVNAAARARYDGARAAQKVRAYQERHPEQAKAKQRVADALKSGRLMRPESCERCGGVGDPAHDGRSSIHAHHEDYSKPLDVIWLCQRCHGERHIELREAAA